MAIRTDYVTKEKITASDANAAFGAIKGSIAGGALFQFNETPAYAGTPGQFRTAFAYRPGTLQVHISKLRQVKDIDHNESADPSAGLPTLFIFLTSPGVTATDPDAAGDEIRVDYMRCDI